jgi:hypothetical protein
MLFRCSYTVRLRIDLKEGQSVILAEPEPGVRVTLKGLPESEMPETGIKLRQLCVVTEQVDGTPEGHRCVALFAQPSTRSFLSLPPECQAFIDLLTERLDEQARRCLALLRWRFAIEGPQYAWEFRRQAEWSSDGENWNEFPHRYSTLMRRLDTFDTSNAVRQEIEALLANATDEPIAHVLWREAWWQRFEAHVSAYVIGMAAAEIGFKRLVAELVPDAGWLVSEVPSPPLDRMLKTYLPILPVRQAFNGRILIPAHIQKAIVAGMKRRNDLVHKDADPPSFEEVEGLLVPVCDLLWLFDYYAGREWAIEHLSDASRAALALEPYGSRNLSAATRPTTPNRS